VTVTVKILITVHSTK